ncbi:acyl carrier protein [Anaerovibrio sp. RM50]|uniref:acyl carrier protein n=1 Tax=Anaerovibrio sp. RM50 TaxID=1200557 RepID=UPI0009079F4F
MGYACSILNPKPEEWIKDFVYKITLEYQMYSSDDTDEYELQHPDDLPDFHAKPEKLTLDMKIIEDVGFDSLDAVEWFMAIEEAINSEIMDAEAEKIVTLQDMYDLLLEKQQKGVIDFKIENIHHDVYLDHVFYEHDEEV